MRKFKNRLFICLDPVIAIPAVGELAYVAGFTAADGLVGVGHNGNAVEEYGVFNVKGSNVHCGNDILFHNWRSPPSSP